MSKVIKRMKPTKNNIKWIGDMSVADVLCSAGYLAPRNEQDVERFERIYAKRSFETEDYHIDSDAIFDKVRGVSHKKARKIRPTTTIYDRPGLLRVAEELDSSSDEMAEDVLNRLMKDKKD